MKKLRFALGALGALKWICVSVGGVLCGLLCGSGNIAVGIALAVCAALGAWVCHLWRIDVRERLNHAYWAARFTMNRYSVNI